MPRLNRHLLEQVLDISTWGESEDLVKGYPVYTAQFSLQKPQVEIKCYCPTEFPVFPPKVFVALSSGESFELPVQWQSSSDIDPEHQLGLLIKEQLLLPVITLNTAPLKSAICYGITNSKIAVTDNKEIAQKQGWQAIYSQNRTLLNIQDEYFARSGGILSKILNEKCVAIFGCGSGGSYIAEQLVRSGLGELVLCDMDRVEAHNLCRSGYEIQDLGVPKVNALSRKLRNINPSIKLELVNDDLMQLKHEFVKRLIEKSQVVVAGTDMPAAQNRLNRYAYSLSKPAIFPGLYDLASGGEIVMTIPGKTPCYECSIQHRRDLLRPFQYGDVAEISANNSNYDYSSGSLKAEPGLAGDIHHLDSISLKLILGLLLQDVSSEERCTTRDFIRGLTTVSSEGEDVTKNFVITCHQPDFWFFPMLRDDTKQDYAYHSVWSETSQYRRIDCPVCGDSPEPLKQQVAVEDIIQAATKNLEDPSL